MPSIRARLIRKLLALSAKLPGTAKPPFPSVEEVAQGLAKRELAASTITVKVREVYVPASWGWNAFGISYSYGVWSEEDSVAATP